MSLCSPVMLPVASSFQQLERSVVGSVRLLSALQPVLLQTFSVCIQQNYWPHHAAADWVDRRHHQLTFLQCLMKGDQIFCRFSLVVWFGYVSLIGWWGSWRLESGHWAEELKSSVTSLSEASLSAAGLRARWEKVTESQNDPNTNICSC